MILSIEHTCDVLVIGCGIAGISAALQAAECGCSVTLLTSANLFSGSSFYPGTWGLGLIGPEDSSDQADLARSIQEVGCGMANPQLVETFVSGIQPAIQEIRNLGIHLRRAVQKDQKEFIPCFDHKCRDWNGIEFDSARPVFSRRIQELGIRTLEHCQVLRLVQHQGRVQGVVAAWEGRIRYLGCRAVVLATGGYGSLFRYHLCTGDVAGEGQALALEVGCKLVNMEFMQMMPGYLHPAPKTIFNEKTFRFTRMRKADGTSLLPPGKASQALLELRSSHGPFTARLASREVDLALFRAFLADERGVEVTYAQEMVDHPPEFITTYFDWLEREKGLTAADAIHIGIFAHAANGGIAIDRNTFTGVPGLFACGEVTGGMHGADRIGGLSTANGLVFGGRAGQAAAAACAETPQPVGQVEFSPLSHPDPAGATRMLQDAMFRHAMVLRTEEGLTATCNQVEALSHAILSASDQTAAPCVSTYRLARQLTTAQCVLKAALLRRESRGSHYRADYPTQDTAQQHPIVVTQQAGQVTAAFQN